MSRIRYQYPSETLAPPPRCPAELEGHPCTLDRGHKAPHAAVTRYGPDGEVRRWAS